MLIAPRDLDCQCTFVEIIPNIFGFIVVICMNHHVFDKLSIVVQYLETH